MKTILEFDSANEDDNPRLACAQKGEAMAYVLWTFDNSFLRGEIKYGTDATRIAVFEECRQELMDLLHDNDVCLDSLVH